MFRKLFPEISLLHILNPNKTSVSVLRTWLFEHFLHLYPNDAEKLMLASQTRLKKNQVENWFINARVRFWKPMMEEMYREGFGESSSSLEDSPSSCCSLLFDTEGIQMAIPLSESCKTVYF